MQRAIVILLACLVGYVFFAVYSVYGLVSGVERRDAAAITDHVDFPAVRASLKEQLTSAMMAEAMGSAGKSDEAGAKIGAGLIAAFGPTMIGNMVDGVVTPSGLINLLKQNNNNKNISSADSFNFGKFASRAEVLTPTRFRVSGDDGTYIVFSFVDLAWKITDITFPPDVLHKRKG